jgi:hypothetical protein
MQLNIQSLFEFIWVILVVGTGESAECILNDELLNILLWNGQNICKQVKDILANSKLNWCSQTVLKYTLRNK